jgi:hypothetical protein
MGSDLAVPGLEVGRRKDRRDLVERHPEIPQPPDHLRRSDLAGVIGPIAGEGVDGGGLKDAHVMVVPERLDAQVRHPGEVTDGQHRRHDLSISPSR